MSLKFEKLDEETLGALWALFEMVVVYLGQMFNLQNVFDQPAVTESRQFIDASLKRLGTEGEQEKLRQTENTIKKHFISYP